jgi:hypothetical protein
MMLPEVSSFEHSDTHMVTLTLEAEMEMGLLLRTTEITM